MHLRNSCTRSTSACCMRQVPSGASGLRGLNGLIFFLTRKFQETSVARSRMPGNARIGSMVMGLSIGSVFMRVMHMSFGMPLISAEQEPHLPALQFQRHGEVVGLRRLDLVDHVEHDHALVHLRGVIHELAAAVFVAAPDSESDRFHFISSMTCFNSAGMVGNGLAPDIHRAVGIFLYDDVDLAGCGVLVREILAEMAAAAFLALNRPSA